MNAHLQEAIAHSAAVAEQARYVTRDEHVTLAVRIGAVANSLRWEQRFLLPDHFVTGLITSKASANMILPYA